MSARLLSLVDNIPRVKGKVKGPKLPSQAQLQGDRAYDSEPHRKELKKKGIKTLLAKRRTAHGSGLGKTRWYIERSSVLAAGVLQTQKWRQEKYPFMHEALMLLACSVICHRFLSC